MPPLFQTRVSINDALLDKLRALPLRIQRNLRNKLQTELKPELQRDVDVFMEQGPEPVSSPFQFGTEQSRKFYFWMINNEPDLTAAGHWLRRGFVEHGFDVQVSDRLRLNLILIRNIQPEARYVFGPWLVRGHELTGWPEQAELAHKMIRDKAVERVRYYAKEAILEALRE